jgi:hypothetical protein
MSRRLVKYLTCAGGLPDYFALPVKYVTRCRKPGALWIGSRTPNKRDAAMTRQTRELRPRYAPIYAVAIIALLAVSASGTGRTQVGNPSPAVDVSAMMSNIGDLPVQGHIDAF